MPNQNSPDPNQNSTTPVADQPVQSTVPFPQSDLPPLPPAFQDVTESSVPPINKSTDQPKDLSFNQPTGLPAEALAQAGSAAPINDISSVVSPSPKKKFGGGRIIATILGILVLVGGVGAGILLTLQPQIFNPKATSCGPDGCISYNAPEIPGEGSSNGQNNNQNNANNPTSNNNTSPTAPPAAPAAAPASAPTTYAGTGVATDSVQGGFGYCSSGCSSTTSTASDWNNPSAVIAGTYVVTTNGVSTREITGTASTYEAAALYNATTHNITSAQNVTTGAAKVSTATVYPPETEQQVVDMINKGFTFVPGGVGCDVSGRSGSGNDGFNAGAGPESSGGVDCGISHWTTCASGTIGEQGLGCVGTSTTATTTTNSTTPTASCSSVTAYNSSWAALTAAQLSALASGTAVNFCVTGTTTGGGFDMAKFTITVDGIAGTPLQTTTKGSGAAASMFCQSYSIPPTGTSFNVTAQIHDSTLGWSN